MPLASAFAASDVSVIGFDVDTARLRAISAGTLQMTEPELADYMGLPSVRNNFRVTDTASDAVANSEACIFVTPTPSLADGSFDHHHVLSAVAMIASEVAKQHKRKYLFVISSTVMPGVCLWEVKPILERYLSELHYGLAYKPEFIALGTVIQDLHYPNVLLIGESSEDAGAAVEQLYARMTFGKPAVKRMELIEAELAKISLNCAVTMKISFANQVGLIAQKLGADPVRILDAVGADPRIGDKSLKPGLPFGGPCFPRDNRMFQRVAIQVSEQAPIAVATDVVNRNVKRNILDKIKQHRGEVGILGAAYKAGTSVADESLGTWLKMALVNAGRKVRIHDVMAPHTHSIEEVLACPVVVLATAWPEYTKLTLNGSVLIDPMGVLGGSNLLQMEASA